MNIIAVDDEPLALLTLEDAIRKAIPEGVLHSFSKALEALEFAKANHIDIAFLDISLGDSSGMILAKKLKDIYGSINIIFVTGYVEYAQEAFALHASGYVEKPVTIEDITMELKHLRNPVVPWQTKGIYIRCFGSFAVFVNGEPLMFRWKKAKELLAFLVHKHGAPANAAEIAGILWENKEYDRSLRSQTQTVISQLMKILRNAGIEDILRREWNNTVINVEAVSCDYYDFLNGKLDSLQTYTGEYMNEYSWAEFTVEFLNKKMK